MKLNRMLLLAFALGFLPSCNRMQLAVEFPDLPDLSAETRKPCPPAGRVTGELGDLAIADAALAIEYARCQARQATAVGAYDTAQRLLRSARDAAERQAGVKRGAQRQNGNSAPSVPPEG